MVSGKMGNGKKCKRNTWLSESWGKKKSVWWNDDIKAAVRRNEAAWKGVLAGSDEETKIDVWKSTEKRRKWLKGI